ncbi:TIGR03668 family PPOX class F420-dependent oxidoreductase [Rhodococcus sp. HNM0569]|uniref:TIGR03668 family PPOX class F420-dependent oxidoreductase n=1 Tax=Rhodococcus sp. HNM0569 TaxID=2716340 RepID=UPI00146F0DFE|nr:TIGR03668 family PPOX class F420-dependent oxidoreductase [Rhodococcus sp. HNM0569]NLU84543.1 TIGR03668 family PPOX class F420-dependent oxidoreductase [Rhodococcus sp. HNM0569]
MSITDADRAAFAAARVARLSTVTPAGDPHIVPIVFAMGAGSRAAASAAHPAETVYWCVDGKPKSTRALARLRNIEQHPRVSMLVDHYDDDWSALWWVRADGVAEILSPGGEAERALDLLATKYSQYRDDRPAGPVIAVRVDRWRTWSAQPHP